ncbi:ABC transporter ATP-binding protein [Capsulimonas corticalis]|uniref:ABC transporter ATP-binding protein n=1 Tax=Capsulimonas corticalis TaxID=2219043 RepID=A0A402D6N1_9BACT|nr:ABC transporter ATP-binding protein [Capsulimonas corticalis]BDI30612.1 ABC transporter ATP-binding protein [Capsulimonas corticalis]
MTDTLTAGRIMPAPLIPEEDPNAGPILRVDRVGKDYPTKSGALTVLEPTSFTMQTSELVSIVGPSGCGKSTLLHIVGGLVEPTSGSVYLDGVEVHEPSRERGMVFQAYTLFPWRTVYQNVQFGLEMRGLPRKGRERIADKFLEAVGLSDFKNHYPKQLSGGMRQRVAIARALANAPRILLMDEPFGALDAQTRAVMQDLVLDIRRRERITTLFITHDIDEAVYLSDRIFVMTARPGHIKAEIHVPFGPDRSDALRNAPEFLEIRKQVHELLYEEGKAVVDAEIASGSKK